MGQVHGYPAPVTTWTKDGNKIMGSKRIRFERHGEGDLKEGDLYAINYGEIIGKDSGTYALTAENEAGTARVEGTVIVNGKF